MVKRVTVNDFRHDPMFLRVERAVAAILASGKVVAPVDVLVKMDILAPKDLEDWRFGRVPCLEHLMRGNLSRLSRLLRIFGLHCHDLNLVASQTGYVRWGKGPRTPLRFTKTGEPRLEKVYARHFVWLGKGPFHPPRARSSNGPDHVSLRALIARPARRASDVTSWEPGTRCTAGSERNRWQTSSLVPTRILSDRRGGGGK
jgi:hypothetical protein